MPFDTARFDFDRGSTMLVALAAAPVAPVTLAPADGWSSGAADDSEPISVGEFCDALTSAAKDAGIPVSFFARLIWQESQFKSDEISHAGAQGVAQFMPETAEEEGLDDPFDPRKALPASARLLRKLRDQLGNLGLAAAAYNAGPGRIQNWVARRATLPAETRNYVHRITGSPAESWLREAKTVGLMQDLPREAPCEGVGGLSRSRPPVAVAVALAPDLRERLQEARRAAARAEAAKHAHRRLEMRGKTRLAGKHAPRAVRIATASR